MFGKRGERVAETANSNLDALQKRVDALQQKILASEKLQTRLFDFIGEFEARVNEAVDKKLKQLSLPSAGAAEIPADFEARVAEILEKKIGEVSPQTGGTSIAELENRIKARLNEVLSKLHTQTERNTTELAELRQAVRALQAGKTPAALPTDELKAEMEGLVNEAKRVIEAVKEATPLDSSGLRKALEEGERELTGKLNAALNQFHRELESTKREMEEFRQGIFSALEAKPGKGGVKPAIQLDELNAFKLTFNKKLAELDYLTSELAKQDYVAIIEAEFRRKINQLNSRINALEFSSFGKQGPALRQFEQRVEGLAGRLEGQESREKTRQELERVWAELKRLSGLAISRGELESLKQELKGLVEKMGRLEQNISNIVKGVERIVSIKASGMAVVGSSPDEITKLREELLQSNRGIAERLEANANELKEFEEYCTTQLKKVNEWIEYVGEVLK